MTLRNTCRLAIALVAVLCSGPKVQAIEMFTNFNNGTEFNTRPIGIDQLPPVRYHWWQPAPGEPIFFRHRCRDSQAVEDGQIQPDAPEAVPAPPGRHSGDMPIRLRAEPTGNSRPDADDSDDRDSTPQEIRRPTHDWRSGGDFRRGESYLPSNQ